MRGASQYIAIYDRRYALIAPLITAKWPIKSKLGETGTSSEVEVEDEDEEGWGGMMGN